MRTAYFPLLGRLGNLLFQYCHARAWCEQNGFELSIDPWIGEKIFTIPEAIRPSQHEPDVSFKERLYQHQKDLIYTRKQVREWLTFKPEILERLQVIPSSPLLLNVREGSDYLGAGNVMISRASYLEASRLVCGETVPEWETDLQRTSLPGFEGNITAGGLGTTAVALPSFYRLMTAKILFRANSTFSWWAATLGTCRVYSPVIKGMAGGIPDRHCDRFAYGNWPMMTETPDTSDLHLEEV